MKKRFISDINVDYFLKSDYAERKIYKTLCKNNFLMLGLLYLFCEADILGAKDKNIYIRLGFIL
jgi:hypothetical protein